jgi:hypothetical protein
MKPRALTRLLAFAALTVLGVSTASAQPARQGVSVVPASPPIQGFSVVLILGSESAQKVTGDLPAGATRALSDLRDFLPYRSYRMLDSAWILNPGSGRTIARLRGVDEHHYRVDLDTVLSGVSRVTVKFALRDDDPRQSSHAGRSVADDPERVRQRAEVARLNATLAALQAELEAMSKKFNPAHPDVIATQQRIQTTHAELVALLARTQPAPTWTATTQVIDTAFTMDVGETVVVGTSRLQGDTALIVLLTAVPKRP